MIYFIISWVLSFISIFPLYKILDVSISGYILIGVILTLSSIIFYPFIRSNMNNFHDSELTTPILIYILSAIMGFLLAYLIFPKNYLFFICGFPITTMILLNYEIIFFNFIQDIKIDGILTLKYIHCKYSLVIFESIIIIKIIILTVESVLGNYNDANNLFWVLSFISDFSIVTFIHNSLNKIHIYQQGFITKKYIYRKKILLISLSLFLALILSRDFSIFSYRSIVDFINSLSPGVYESGSFINEGTTSSIEYNGFLDSLDSSGTGSEIFPVIQTVLLFIGRLFLLFSGLFIIYLIIWPFIRPFLKRNRNKVTLKDEFLVLIRKIRLFILALFRVDRGRVYKDRSFKTVVAGGSGKIFDKKVRIEGKLNRIYYKLIKYSYKNNYLLEHNFTVDRFIDVLSENINYKDINLLRELLNRGFYSRGGIDKKSLKMVGNIVKDIIKG